MQSQVEKRFDFEWDQQLTQKENKQSIYQIQSQQLISNQQIKNDDKVIQSFKIQLPKNSSQNILGLVTAYIFENVQKPIVEINQFFGIKVDGRMIKFNTEQFKDLEKIKLIPKKEDFDDEAQKLFKKLNISSTGAKSILGHSYHDLDVVYQHPKTGAKFFIGNIQAAQSLDILQKQNVYNIINCQELKSRNFHENNSKFTYFRFPVSLWMSSPGVDTDEGILKYFNGVHSFIDQKLEQGQNVMCHCLAGAHRAGTTGVSYIMHAAKIKAQDAIILAKQQRPIVDPFGTLQELLRRLEKAQNSSLKQNNNTDVISVKFNPSKCQLTFILNDDQKIIHEEKSLAQNSFYVYFKSDSENLPQIMK